MKSKRKKKSRILFLQAKTARFQNLNKVRMKRKERKRKRRARMRGLQILRVLRRRGT